jgi:PKD domain
VKRALVPLIVSMVVLANASAAAAKEWCIAPASGCADGNVATFQSALDLAKSNAGPDQIRLGAAMYDGPFTYDDNSSSTNSVAITGASSTATTLTRSSLGAIFTITSSGGALNSLTDMGFHITQSSSAGLQGGRVDTTRVAVAGDPAITNSVGLTLASGAVRSVNVSMPVSGSNQGVFVGGGTAGDGVFDSTISGDNAVNVPLAVVQRCDVTGGHFGVATMSGRIDDVLVHVSGTGPDRAGLDATNNSIADGSAIARHLTILGANTGPGSIGIRVFGDSSFTGHTESLDVRNTIVRGVEHSYRRATHTTAPAGTANLTMHYTDYDPGTRDDSGLGSGPDPSDATNPNTDPAFVDPAHGDFRLAASSPLIDKGDPAPLAAGEPSTDFGGLPRVVNGRTDIGAHEYQRRPPFIVAVTADRLAAEPNVPFRFGVLAGDYDGDAVSYRWAFDDGASATGSVAEHAFATTGMHVATATVTDSTGLTASAQVTVGVFQDPRKILAALSLSPKKFRAGSGKKKGTTVRFTLALPAKVSFRVVRMPGSRRVKGSFTRKGVAGKNKFRFAGRIGGKKLKPGSYRLIGTVGKGKTASIRRAAFAIER